MSDHPRRDGGSTPWAAALAPALLVCIALAGCTHGAPPPSAQARADAAAVAACRERADQVYEQQNRATIYSPQAAVNTPSSGAYAPGGAGDRGLASLYARDSLIRDCVRNTGSETDRGMAPTVRNAP